MSAHFCGGCGALVHLAPTNRPNVLASVEYDPDGYTPSGIRHVCHNSVGDRAGWLVAARRAVGSPATEEETGRG